MASKKLNSATTPPLEDMGVDMSPMIDMVFLLLIFFMVASTLITDKKIDGLEMPITPDGKDPQMGVKKITINVFSEKVMLEKGRKSPFADVNGKEITEADISKIVREANDKAKAEGRDAVLYVRGDRGALVLQMKQVLQASGAGGVQDVIFSGLTRKVGE
mgnify:CR=1 FL=1